VTPKRAAKVDAILTALRVKSPQAPADLAKVLKLRSVSTLAYQMKPLLNSGAVLATGVTADRRYSLAPRSKAAKEVP
jgi:hypothetical protein